MSTGEWLALGTGIGIWAVMIAAMAFRKKLPGCPDCHHEDGADERGRCMNIDSYSGWGSDECRCTNEFHRAHSSQTA